MPLASIKKKVKGYTTYKVKLYSLEFIRVLRINSISYSSVTISP